MRVVKRRKMKTEPVALSVYSYHWRSLARKTQGFFIELDKVHLREVQRVLQLCVLFFVHKLEV